MNYKQLFAKQKEYEKILRKACPTINSESGIYFYKREENGKIYYYIGKAKNLLERNISHCMGYSQRIDISIRKRGFYSEENTLGWKLSVRNYPLSELDYMEQYWIDKAKNIDGVELYNIESGGTVGKEIIGERKAPKTYLDGIKQGKKNIQREIKHWFETSLDFAIKGKSNKNKEKAFEKFKEFLGEQL